LIDHFYWRRNSEKIFEEISKSCKKPGEKIYDFAIRLKEIFKFAYPDAYIQYVFQ
jgi:hypothetical protein